MGNPMKFNKTSILLLLLFLFSLSEAGCIKARVQIETFDPETSVTKECNGSWFSPCRIQIPEGAEPS